MRTKLHDLIDSIRKGTHLNAWTERPSRLPARLADEFAVMPVYVLAQEASAAMSEDLIAEADRLLAQGALPCPYGDFLLEFDVVAHDGVAHVVASVNDYDPIEVTYSCEIRGMWVSDLTIIRLQTGKGSVALPPVTVFDPIKMAGLDERTRCIEGVVKSFLAAMAVRGAETEAVEAPAALNKARVRNGRPQVRQYTGVRSLTLPKAGVTKAGGKGGTHASPVPHYRSGCSYVRRRDGREISRRPTVVNAHKLAPGQTPPTPRVAVTLC